MVEHRVLTPAGRPGIYGTVHFKNLALGVVPIDDLGRTVLVGQYRYALDAYSWELPEGGGAHHVAPLDSARRELREETGLEAACWQEILRLELSNSVSDERAIGYLAWRLEQHDPDPEDVEQLALRRLPFAAALAMVERGEITDALSVALILKVQLMALAGQLPDEIAGPILAPSRR